MSETKSYYKSFVTMLSGNVISQIIPFAIAPILTRIYTKEDFAIFANYLAIASMIGIVSTGRLEIAIPIAKDKSDAQRIVATGLFITIILVSLSFVFPVFSEFFSNLYNSPQLEIYLILIPIAILSIGLLGVITNWVLRLKKYTVLSMGKVSQSIVNNGLAAGLGFLGWGVKGMIIAWLLSQFVGILMMFFFIDKKVTVKEHSIVTIKNTLREYKDFPLINSLHAFTDVFATQVVLFWIISNFFGLPELGVFVVMNKYVRAPIVLITSSVSSIFYTEMGTCINNDISPIPILKKTISTSFAFSIPFIIILLFFAPQLFGWYLGSDWAIAGSYAQRIVPILLMMFILSPISSIPILFNQQKKAFLISLAGYTVTLSSLFVVSEFHWDFLDALTIYGIVYALYQLTYLYWFYRLIKNRHAYIN